MNLREFELDKMVTLRQVVKALENSFSESGYGYHTVDIGDFGSHDIDCVFDREIDIECVLRGLA